MSIFNNGNFAKPFSVSQPQLNSSDRTANLRSKTKYEAAVNLAKNGGVLTKQDGSKYVGPVHTTSATMTSADSYSDLLDVTKGKYLLTPPPSSNLDTSFSPASGDVFYGSFTVTDYAEAKIPVTMLGLPEVATNKYVYPNQLVASSTAPPPFNNTSIVVDPEYRLFYGKRTCGMRDYFKNVRIDPSADVRWTADGVVYSSRPYNQQQAQRIIAHEAQRLRGFQYPTRVHLDLDNCESKPSITPVAPDAPVIYISSQTLTSDEPELFTVTVAWPHGFDGGSPITQYTVYTSTGDSHTVDPQPCLNSYTLYNIALTTQIWVTATNCIPQSSWASSAPAPHCTPMTSPHSNPVNPAPPHLPTITIAFSSGPNPMPYEPNKVITMTITSDNPMPFSVTSSQLDDGLAQLNPPNSGTRAVSLSATNGYSITLLPGKNPTAARTTISVSFMQASGAGYSRGFATATLVILPALPPQIVFKLKSSSATTLTVPYEPNKVITMTISTSNYPVAQSAYQVSSSNTNLVQISSDNTSIQLLPNANPPAQTTVTITVIQPATLNYPSGTATKTLTITPAPPPIITLSLTSPVTYAPGKNIPLTITSTNPTSPAPIVASAGSVMFQLSGAVGNLTVSFTDYDNYVVGQILTATAEPGGGSFGGATVTVTSKNIQMDWILPFYTIYVSIVGGSPITGGDLGISNVMASSPKYTVTSNSALVQINPPSSGSSDYTVVLGSTAPTTPVVITATQAASGGFAQGTGTTTLVITPPVPIITLGLTSPVTYAPGKNIPLTITSTNPTSPAPIVASAGSVMFQLSGAVGNLTVSFTDYDNYVVGQILTATAEPGGGSFGGATVTVTSKNIQMDWILPFYTIYVSIVGGSPITGGDLGISNVMASSPKYTVTSNSALVQINPPSSGSSDYTVVLGSTAPTTPVVITATQAASGGFAQGTGTTTLDIVLLPPISWTISPSITFASVHLGGNIYIGTGPDANIIPAPTNSDSSIAYSAELVGPSNLQPCVSVTQAQGSTSAYLTLSRPDPIGSLAEYNIIATQYGKTASIRIKFSETDRLNVGIILVVQVMNV